MAAAGNSKKYRSLNEFLKAHVVKDKNAEEITHTRIGNLNSKKEGEREIFPGKYCIPDEEMTTFMKLYERAVFINKQSEYLTEVQRKDGTGPLLVDLDFRYSTSVTERQHNEDIVKDLIETYVEKILKSYDFNGKSFPVYAFEKPSVNKQDTVTKDGIHLVFGVQMDHVGQQMIRSEVLSESLECLGDLELTNTYDSVLDEGISKGGTNWQLIGSCKPGNETYALTKYCIINVHGEDPDDFENIPKEPSDIKIGELLKKATARSRSYVSGSLLASATAKYNDFKVKTMKSKRSRGVGASNNALGVSGIAINFDDIRTRDALEEMCESIVERFENSHYDTAFQAHRFTMALSELQGEKSYVDPYDKWIKVGWALRNTHKDLFLTWMLFSSKSIKFNCDDIPEYFDMWLGFNDGGEGLTVGSIAFWCRQELPDEYKRIWEDSVDFFVDRCFKNKHLNIATEYDLAELMYFILKDRFRCVIESGGGTSKRIMWYEFKNHRWVECVGGVPIRNFISTDISRLFTTKAEDIFAQKEEADSDRSGNVHHILMKTAENCGKPSYKDGVMKEAAEIFFTKHPEFKENMNSKRHIFGFTNGVADMKNGIFRPGEPDDYLTQTSGVEFIMVDTENNAVHAAIMDEILDFFSKIFPDPSLFEYTLDLLAATATGAANKLQTFHLFNGGGSNGKGALFSLLMRSMGDYIKEGKLSILTQQRAKTGSAEPEVAMLENAHLLVFQEPSEGDKFNTGVLKQYSGGEDTITCRGLFREPKTFIPRFTMCVCTNHLPEIKSDDGGTWRRIRVVDFESKFIGPGDVVMKSEQKHVFQKDEKLSARFNDWAPYFMSFLVMRAWKTEGKLVPCERVLQASKEYRNSQNVFAQFLDEMTTQVNDGDESDDSAANVVMIQKSELNTQCKKWYEDNYDKRTCPSAKELYSAADKRFGKAKRAKRARKMGWVGYRIVYNDADIDEELSDDDSFD